MMRVYRPLVMQYITKLQETRKINSFVHKPKNLSFTIIVRLCNYERQNRSNEQGTLPGEIGNLDLQILFLDGNSLSGRIPFKIFNISTIIDSAL
ncbi:hypothetical protein LguiB_018069 [Lonicera macranthoides]